MPVQTVQRHEMENSADSKNVMHMMRMIWVVGSLINSKFPNLAVSWLNRS